jgi:L-ascorbate metabolism protein UlaG (beta-lactamase superfamily)
MMATDKPALIDQLHWIGHDSFRLDAPLVIYIDPWRLPEESPAADLILVSHEHHDHCSPEDIERIRQPKTLILASGGAAGMIGASAEVLHPGEARSVGTIKIETVPAYNLEKPFHPRASDHLGFILEIEGERLYFAGDTDLIPEMEDIQCDVALLPVSGKYVMDVAEAVRAAGVLNPRVAIPMHYGAGVVGTLADAARFQELSPVPVLVLSQEP